MTYPRRPRHEMPDFIRNSFLEHGLDEVYRSRPPYQRNDYIGWIAGAKREETRQKRLNQMLDELRGGDRYMNMAYRPRVGQPNEAALAQQMSLGSGSSPPTSGT